MYICNIWKGSVFLKKTYYVFLLAFTFAFLFVISADNTKAAENTEEENSIEMPKFYDENNNEIKPYTEEEYIQKREEAIEESEQAIEPKNSLKAENKISLKSALYPNHYDTFGYATFKNFVWINKEKLYKDPSYVNLERANRTTGLAVYFYNSSGTYKGKAVFPKYGNIWEVATTDHLTRGKSYKFKLVSESGEKAEVTHGNIGYD